MSEKDTAADESSSIDPWQQIHTTLLAAVREAELAVAAQKSQRRFWLEELCGNLTEDGSLTATSVWKRSTSSTKTAASKTAAAAAKRKRTTSPTAAKKNAKIKVQHQPPADPPAFSYWQPVSAGMPVPASNLHLMAAVAFGANHARASPVDQSNPPYPGYYPTNYTAEIPAQLKTYSSIQDVDDEELDNDAF